MSTLHPTNQEAGKSRDIDGASVGSRRPVTWDDICNYYEQLWGSQLNQLVLGRFGQEPTNVIISASTAMKELIRKVERVSLSDASILLQGESGTGKEGLTHFIHQNSGRSNKHLEIIDGTQIHDNLSESQLFGHRKGAFTGADSDQQGSLVKANAGTVFIDQIDDLKPHLQGKFLRVLAEGKVQPVGSLNWIPVDIRFICASTENLAHKVAERTFRGDLYFRLRVPLRVPPLRERPEDILLLAKFFIAFFSLTERRFQITKISPCAAKKLNIHKWPFNVREMECVIYKAILYAPGPSLKNADIVFEDFDQKVADLPIKTKFCVALLTKRQNHRADQLREYYDELRGLPKASAIGHISKLLSLKEKQARRIYDKIRAVGLV